MATTAWATPRLVTLASGYEADYEPGKSNKHQSNDEQSGASCDAGKGCPGPQDGDVDLGPS